MGPCRAPTASWCAHEQLHSHHPLPGLQQPRPGHARHAREVGALQTLFTGLPDHPPQRGSRARADATAHAPAPNWIDVDREGLNGKITALPQRSELVQIQLNEQLIVELYSK